MSRHQSFHLFWIVLKLQRWLFSVCWRLFMLVYFAIGLGALVVLFFIEARFFIQLTQYPALGYSIAAIFGVANIGTSIVKQAITIANRVSRIRVSWFIRSISGLFQVSLVAVCLFCSVVVVSSYLDGSAFILRRAEGRVASSSRTQQFRKVHGCCPLISATLATLREGLNLRLNPSTFTSGFALLFSLLLQGTVYIVFGHLIATQSQEIEHIFEVKMHRLDAKKNSIPSI